MKKLLYILLIPLLLIEWTIDIGAQIVKIIHNSIEVLTLSLQTYINESTGQATSADKTNRAD